jgi:signal transduction histidine kinase
MVREVLDNLVGNALKHAPDGTMVVVSTRAAGGQVRFDVRDSGPGIPESEQAALFERWTRTDSSRTKQLPGTGLGLSIVKRLVTAHGGTVGVSSRPGDGATFWVTFPVPA